MKKILICGFLFLAISHQNFAQTPWQNYKDKLREKSDDGDVEAMGMLGVSLFSEELPSPSHSSIRSEAELLLEKSAKLGSVTAKDVYNRWFLQNNEPLNEEEIIELADKGNEVAQFLYAAYLKSQNDGALTEKARDYYNKSAASNFSPAYLQLGLSVENGDERLKLLKIASDQGLKIAEMLYYYNIAKFSGDKSDMIKTYIATENLANQGFGPAIDFTISLYTNGDENSGLNADIAKANYFLVKKYIPLTGDNDSLLPSSPKKEEVLSAMIGDLMIFKRQPEIRLQEIKLERGEKLQSNGAKGIPKGTEVYPIKISPIIKGNPLTSATIYYFYKDEFKEWKFKQ
jgi:hypothetical protein